MPQRPPIHRSVVAGPCRDKQYDAVRDRENPWRKWYRTSKWRRRRAKQLAMEPLCRMCAARGRVTPASVADHVIPHRGDEHLFWHGELQSLCKPCHDSDKQAMERGRTRVRVGLDGYPVQPSNVKEN